MAEKLKIIPLGGLNEIGKNMTAYEYGGEIIVVDCGRHNKRKTSVVRTAPFRRRRFGFACSVLVLRFRETAQSWRRVCLKPTYGKFLYYSTARTC